MKDLQLAQNPIFVVGCPRSGTTLLQALIASQGELITLPETHFFGTALNLGLLDRDSYSKEQANAILAQMEGLGRLDITEQVMSEFDALATAGQIRQKELFELVVKSLAPDGIAPDERWIEKTPSNGLCLPRIAQLYPEALFVAIVRDPFNAIHSILQNFPPNRGNKYKKVARIWAQHQQVTQDFLQRQPQKIIVIKYESLAEDPQKTLAEICRFLNINFKPEKMHISQELKQKIVKKFETWKASITNRIENNNVPGPDLFNPIKILQIQGQISPYAEKLGYRTYFKSVQKIYNAISRSKNICLGR